MSFWEKFLYSKEIDDTNEIILSNGIVYSEKPSIFDVFKKKPKSIRIVFNKEVNKNE